LEKTYRQRKEYTKVTRLKKVTTSGRKEKPGGSEIQGFTFLLDRGGKPFRGELIKAGVRKRRNPFSLKAGSKGVKESRSSLSANRSSWEKGGKEICAGDGKASQIIVFYQIKRQEFDHDARMGTEGKDNVFGGAYKGKRPIAIRVKSYAADLGAGGEFGVIQI